MVEDNVRKTIFLPKWWTLKDLMDPQQAISELLLGLHDEEGDGAADCDDRRWELLTFADELEQAIDIKCSSEGSVIFEININDIPLGFRKEINLNPTLQKILEDAWDVIDECTVGADSWMYDWWATHVIIKPWLGRNGEDKILIKCIKANWGTR